jgi:hypothetical protein
MSEEPNDGDDELGEAGEQLDGIMNRFDSSTEDTADTTETSEMAETSETSQRAGGQCSKTTETADTRESSTTTETAETIETTETPTPGDDEFQLREYWNGRTVYLPDNVVEEVDILYQELTLEQQKAEGAPLPKNERFYPAVFRVAVEHPELIREELGLGE